MPECQVHDCRLQQGVKDGLGVSFFTIPDGRKPEKKNIAARWLHFCGTGHHVKTFKFGRDKKVCERHFTPDCFIEDTHIKMAKALGHKVTKPKALAPGSIPTVVTQHRQTYDPERAARAQQREDKKVKQYQYILIVLSHIS